jgi:thymidine phosphorylase
VLIESGPQPEAWIAGAAGKIVPAAAGQALAGTGLTIFDLQMPFLYWADFTYEGQAKLRGRPTHSFILRPPSGYVPPQPGLTGVRVLLDVQFQAMVQAELLGPKGAVEKSIVLLDLKKVGEQWLVKTIDVRDLRSRDKTRLTITAAALSLALPVETFTPDNLLGAPPAIPPGKVVRF